MGWHDEYHAITPHRSCHGQSNARVTTGGFNQRISGGNVTSSFRLRDHAHRRPILYRPRRVIAFELYQYRIGGLPRQALEPDQRGFTYGVFNRWIVRHWLFRRM